MKFRAFAKINLGLEVLSRREDGYHELATILQTIGLHDELEFSRLPEGISLSCDEDGIPTGPENLICRAASLMRPHASEPSGASIRLTKRIPAGRGLGGGSSDAAITLLALNELWQCGLSRDRLHEIAVGIGMDVPFFLQGGMSVGSGRGERLAPVDCELDIPIVLISPEFAISTRSAYQGLRLTKRRASSKLQPFLSAVKANRLDFAGLTNDLEKTTGDHSAAIQAIKRDLLERGALAAMMSGSGSAVFGVFETHEQASVVATAMDSHRHAALVTNMLGRRAYQDLVRLDVQGG